MLTVAVAARPIVVHMLTVDDLPGWMVPSKECDGPIADPVSTNNILLRATMAARGGHG